MARVIILYVDCGGVSVLRAFVHIVDFTCISNIHTMANKVLELRLELEFAREYEFFKNVSALLNKNLEINK